MTTIPIDSIRPITRALLTIVADYPGQFGAQRVARYLRGDDQLHYPVGDPRDTIRIAPCPDAVAISQRQVDSIVLAALDAGYLIRSHGPRPTLCATHKGLQMLTLLTDAEVNA